MRIDEKFCKRIERAERDGLRDALEFGEAAFPERGIVVAQIAGATVGYAGIDSPFSQATGIGIDADVREADIEAIVAFYHSRGTAARVTTSPMNDAEVAAKLTRRGFEIEEYQNAMTADLTQTSGARDPRIDVCKDPAEWANHSARAFTDDENPSEALVFVSTLMASHPNVSALVLKENEEIQTSGCLALERNGIAALFATATSARARNRGFQSAMIAHRIARAVERGAAFARATAKPASASERNFRRLGFSVLYTRTVWSLKP